MAGCGALYAVSGIPGSNHGRQRRKRSEVSAAGSAAVRPQPRGGRGGRTPTARTSAQLKPSSSVCPPPTGQLARLAGHHGGAAAQPLQMAVVRHGSGHPTGDAAHVSDTRCPQRGRRTGRCPLADRPADMTVEAAAEGPQRFRPGGGTGTGRRIPDRSGSTLPGYPVRPQDDLAAHRTGRPKQRTVNPPIALARYNFLYSSSRPALQAACGRPPARQRHDRHRRTVLTLHIRRGMVKGRPRCRARRRRR
jgi:hypothetical protein